MTEKKFGAKRWFACCDEWTSEVASPVDAVEAVVNDVLLVLLVVDVFKFKFLEQGDARRFSMVNTDDLRVMAVGWLWSITLCKLDKDFFEINFPPPLDDALCWTLLLILSINSGDTDETELDVKEVEPAIRVL